MAQHLNPESEAQKTVAAFRDSAENKSNISAVWQQMATESKGFRGGSADDKAYFNAVSQGLKASGLLPELTIQYARLHHDDLMGDNDQIGKHDINQWEHTRMAENHRITPVEQELIDGMKNHFDAIKSSTKLFQRHTDGITDYEMDNYQAKRSQERHAREGTHEQAQELHNSAQNMLNGLTANNGLLFKKLSEGQSGKTITPDSLDKAWDVDEANRAVGKPSYLNYQERVVLQQLKAHISDMTERPYVWGHIHKCDNHLTMADVVAYAKAHGGT
jgi:hypothetical protein